MNLFQKILSSLKATPTAPVPGPMGDILLSMGITEIKPARRGTPINVLMGCKPELVVIPNTSHVARRRDGSVIMTKDRHGRAIPVMQSHGVDRRIWKQMVNDQKRKANGRWYSGEPADVREARLARRA